MTRKPLTKVIANYEFSTALGDCIHGQQHEPKVWWSGVRCLTYLPGRKLWSAGNHDLRRKKNISVEAKTMEGAVRKLLRAEARAKAGGKKREVTTFKVGDERTWGSLSPTAPFGIITHIDKEAGTITIESAMEGGRK